MTKLDEEVERLARRLAVARLALAQGGPAELLLVILAPVLDSIELVNQQAMHDGQSTFKPVDQPIGPATTRVLADMVSPVPVLVESDRGTAAVPLIRAVPSEMDDWPWEIHMLDHVHDPNGRCLKNRYDGADESGRCRTSPTLPRDAVLGDNGEIITADGSTGRTYVHGCGHSHLPGTECPDADA